jgi:histidinol-phosphate aminotransferase
MNERPLRVEPAPALSQLAPYTTGRPDHGIDLVLDFNESLVPPAPVRSDRDAEQWSVNRYPTQDRLERVLADRLGVDPASVVATCGADDALERTVRVACWPGRRAVLTTPSYGMIRRFAVIAGAEVATVPWWRGDYPLAEVLAAAGGGPGLVAVVTPNNPTGAVISAADLDRLATVLDRSIILVDQAYVDFTGRENDLLEVALGHPNVVMVRTLSKAWGAAGLRVGYAVADPRVADWLRRIGLPFPVSTPSAALALSVLEDGGPERERIERILDERGRLIELLQRFGAEPLPSEGSFVLARFEQARLVWRGLAAFGIAVRAFPGRDELDGWLRFTLPGDEAAFDRLCRGLEAVLDPEALLFDLDGVLADVSGSYREAIRRTAESYGVELSADDIAQAKAAGDANNDWRLTERLLRKRGVEVSLDEVTARFEAFYQGTDDEPGLHTTETLTVPRELLERLAGQRPLGIVTGRPAADAERFLTRHEIRDLFAVVVTMEDGPPKPDPAPVRRALERLGVGRAWLVGDTVDDVRAARRAGVMPVGVPAPADDPATAAAALEHAGAAAVLPNTPSIMEVLP